MKVSLSTLDYSIIILYFIAMLAIGIISVKFAKSKEDYLVAGRRLNFPMFCGCMAAMAVGGAATVGSSKLGYNFGIGGIWLGVSLGLGLLLLAFLASSKLSKLRILSINELLEGNFGTSARVFGGVLTLIYALFLSVVQVISMGSILTGVLGWSTSNSMLFGGGIVIIYTFIGGMWSVTMTDIVQFVIKTLGVLLLAPIFAIIYVGGIDKMTANLTSTHMDITSMGWSSILLYVLMYVPGIVISQDIWQRQFTARTKTIAKTGTVVAGVYSMFYAVATVLIGMCVFAVMPNLADPQDTFVIGISTFLPVGLKGFVLAAAMAATMSVASGTVLACSTILYNDVYTRFVNHEEANKTGVWINRVFAFVIGVIIMLLAFVIKDIFTALDLAYAFLSGCVFVPVMASFVFKKVSGRAGLMTLVVSTIVVLISIFTLGLTTNYPITFGIVSGAITYFVVYKLDKNKKDSVVDELTIEETGAEKAE